MGHRQRRLGQQQQQQIPSSIRLGLSERSIVRPFARSPIRSCSSIEIFFFLQHTCTWPGEKGCFAFCGCHRSSICACGMLAQDNRYLFAAHFFFSTGDLLFSHFSARSGVGMSSNGLACHLMGLFVCARGRKFFDRSIWGLKGW